MLTRDRAETRIAEGRQVQREQMSCPSGNERFIYIYDDASQQLDRAFRVRLLIPA